MCSHMFRISILTTNLYRKYTKNRFSRAFIEKRNLLPRNLRACHLIPHKQHEAFNVTNEHVSSVFSTCRQRMEDGTSHETLSGATGHEQSHTIQGTFSAGCRRRTIARQFRSTRPRNLCSVACGGRQFPSPRPRNLRSVACGGSSTCTG